MAKAELELLEKISNQLDVISLKMNLAMTKPQTVFAIGMGDLNQIAHADPICFTPEYLADLSEKMRQILNAKPKIDPAKSGEYKKPKAQA